jgi:glycine/D-amino acid oxidase-like deaminating enzyme/nitrite reductase/ring-hydroxylating ferredoxin subunit
MSIAMTSPWRETSKSPSYLPLQEEVHADVCVVGAGIAGLSTAYFLTRAGQKVVVLDDGPVAGGQTEMTTAHLSNAIDERYVRLEKLHGPEGARLAAEAHTRAIDAIESIVREHSISCEFERLDGYLFTPTNEPVAWLKDECDAALRTGAVDVALVERAPLSTFNTGTCLRFARQGQFHPLKYITGLAKAIVAGGGQIYTNTHATSVEGGRPARIAAESGSVISNAVVVATHSPVNDRFSLHTKQRAYMSYVVAAAVPKASVERALYWDTLDPYHYVRLRSVHKRTAGESYDLLIVGGEDHETGQADDGLERFRRLEQWARERFPSMREVEYRWSGQVFDTIDGLAYIGRNPSDADNVYVATGFCGQGMTHGTIAGMLISDLILGRENPWTKVFEPSRLTLRAGGEYIRELANMNLQYAAWVTPGDVGSVDEVPPGSGAIMRSGLSKVAVYRDDEGRVHQLSAVCPHLGGIVAWNSTEQTWDCPLHGSRFRNTGEVINGPANSGLTQIDKD